MNNGEAVLFKELKIFDKFTYILFGEGEVKFIKTFEPLTGMRLDTEILHKFHSNDTVKFTLD